MGIFRKSPHDHVLNDNGQGGDTFAQRWWWSREVLARDLSKRALKWPCATYPLVHDNAQGVLIACRSWPAL